VRYFELDRTCTACPEQYDVYHAGKRVGYFRLRHGCFTAELVSDSDPDDFGDLVYSASPNGDGVFQDDERVHHLNAACRALDRAMNSIRDEVETVPIYGTYAEPKK